MEGKLNNIPKFSMIVCSYNRAPFLETFFRQLHTMDLIKNNVQLVLVNNASTDNTEKIINSFIDNNPDLNCLVVFERKKGLGNARNAGLNAATGDVILFTDDDCYLSENYFSDLKRACQSREFDYCGGTIGLFDNTDSVYGCFIRDTDEEIEPYSFIPCGKIQGAQMIIKRKVFETIGYFDPLLGAGKPFRFEDVDYIGRASMAGMKGAYIRELYLAHHHRRKDGSKELKDLMAVNDYTRGGYYAKLSLLGKFNFMNYFFNSWADKDGVKSYARELYGAFAFLMYSLMNFKYPKKEIFKIKR